MDLEFGLKLGAKQIRLQKVPMKLISWISAHNNLVILLGIPWNTPDNSLEIIIMLILIIR